MKKIVFFSLLALIFFSCTKDATTGTSDTNNSVAINTTKLIVYGGSGASSYAISDPTNNIVAYYYAATTTPANESDYIVKSNTTYSIKWSAAPNPSPSQFSSSFDVKNYSEIAVRLSGGKLYIEYYNLKTE